MEVIVMLVHSIGDTANVGGGSTRGSSDSYEGQRYCDGVSFHKDTRGGFRIDSILPALGVAAEFRYECRILVRA